MASSWDEALKRWTAAGLIDSALEQNIRNWEAANNPQRSTDRFVALLFGFGGLLLMAGAFLFVAAHWEALGPGSRYTLVLAVLALFHVAGAYASRKMPHLATVLHSVGTAFLGAGIFLCGQIFNMAEHWPGALLLWAAGAACGWALLRDWPHALWLAILVPTWLWGEWIEDVGRGPSDLQNMVPLVGTLVLAFVYLAAPRGDHAPTWRLAVSRLGAVALIPACIAVGIVHESSYSMAERHAMPVLQGQILPWSIALGLPLALGAILMGRRAAYLILPVLWSIALAQFSWHDSADKIALYALYIVGAFLVAIWGIKEQRRSCINLGVIGFALTLMFFYFSDVYDKLGRSLGLIGMGIVFLGGGWALERVRRRLLANMKGAR